MNDNRKFAAQPVTILLVDDDSDCRTLIRDAIEQGKLENSVCEVASQSITFGQIHAAAWLQRCLILKGPAKWTAKKDLE